MKLAKVIGTTVATVKDPQFVTFKLLLCVGCGVDGTVRDREPIVAVDTVGAGAGEVVLVVEGSAARVSEQTQRAPTDATIIGIVDSIETGEGTTYAKGSTRRRDARTTV